MEKLLKTAKIGRVKVFDTERGFGFITLWEEDYSEHFVHVSRLKSEKIEAGDFVAFDLAPSRKKPGTTEAVKVLQLGDVTDNHFLVEAYFKIDDDNFRRSVFKALSVESVLSIVEREATSFQTIDNADHVAAYLKLGLRLQTYISNDSLKQGLKKIMSAWAQKITTPSVLVTLWLSGQLDLAINFELISESFCEGDRTTRMRIFNKADDAQKKELTRLLFPIISPSEVLSFLGEHIRSVNGLDTYGYFRKLLEPGYWDGKKGFSLLQMALEHYDKTCDDAERFELCIAGYPLRFPQDYALTNLNSLSKEAISRIISRGLIEQNQMELFYSCLVGRGPEEDSTSFLMWLYNEVRNFKGEEEMKSLDRICIDKLSAQTYFELWENGITGSLPVETLKNYLKASPSFFNVDRWIRSGRIQKDEFTDILLEVLSELAEISSRKQFYHFNDCLSGLRNLGISEEAISNRLPEKFAPFQNVSRWLSDPVALNYSLIKPYFLFLSHTDQYLFLRAAFHLCHTGSLKLTADELVSITETPAPPDKDTEQTDLNISIDIIIRAIKSFQRTGKFLVDYDLIAITLKNLSGKETSRLQIGELFEKCGGRMEAQYNWNTAGEITKVPFGNGQFYFAITIPTQIKSWGRRGEHWQANPSFEEDKEAVKQIPGRKYNSKESHWGVPSSQEAEVLRFARERRFFVNFGGNNYSNNPHLAEFKRKEVPAGIVFCEGRPANQPHQTFKSDFYWCCNQHCFQNCETIHSEDQWKNYSFLDFLLILGFQLHDVNRVHDYIDKGKYYQFISSINRFNRLLQRMYCNGCNHILHPVEDSHFAHYRVVRFSCHNESCQQHGQEIYLHHCMNGKCNGIIDSRVSQKCPNGLYICSNEKCGCCCSNDMMKRRLDNLKATGGVIPNNLLHFINSGAGHLEKDERYCYKCGGKMKGSENHYECESCRVSYNTETTRPSSKTRKTVKEETLESAPDFF